MKRLAFAVILAVLIVVPAVGIAAPTPYVATAACTWLSNGQVVTEPDGSKIMCHCTRVEAIDEWWCTWVDLPEQAKPSRYRTKHRFRGVRYYAHPRVAAWIA